MSHQSITDQVYQHILDNNPDIKDLRQNDIFYNPRRKSLRLTMFGNKLLKKEFDYEILAIPDSKKITMRHILILEKTMSWPYFIPHSRDKITLYNDEDIVTFKLMGNIDSWVSGM